MGTGCAGESTATIGGNTTKKQDDAAREQKRRHEAQAAGIDPDAPYGRWGDGSPKDAPDYLSPGYKPPTGQTAADYNTANKPDPNNPLGFSVAPPPESPDLTSQAVKQRKASQTLLLLAGRGRRQTFAGENIGPGALSRGNNIGG